ncbi:MAG: FAD:protein FMN transferase [bacterium]|nr:FAD:protein FMN transferase [bacterium]MDW8163398.1 FAD:protein FMN transferase [Candidatus Omnitrophota bacterium]
MKNKILLFFIIQNLFCFSKDLVFINKTEFLLDTFFEIKIENSKNSEKFIEEGFELAKKLEEKLSIFKEKSEVSMLNKEKILKVSPEVLEVIKKSIYISKITEGAFDITCKPLIDLYKKKSKKGTLPTEKEIKETIRKIGWEKIRIDGDRIILDKEMEIDLGGIAKGFIVDKVSEFFKKCGIKNGLINAGGEIYCWGLNEKKKKWKIGIENPFEEGGIIESFTLTDKGIATSGNYKRYLKLKDKKIGHIFNPKTGLPVEEIPVSVTVIASYCTIADGLATGIFVLGIEKGINIVENLENVECLIIDKNKKIYKSSKFPSNF